VSRQQWGEQVQSNSADGYVFLDEAGTHLGMTPLYARSPRGQRAYGQIPRKRGSNISLLASLSQEGMKAAMTVDGAIDGLTFDAYVEQVLVPTLQPGQTVIMDNLRVHNSAKAIAFIEQAGCTVKYLPSYSPDFNPIESAFSKVKTLLRQAKARSRQLLDKAIAAALNAVTPRDTKGFFARAGYHFTVQHL
jgi:transposase